MTSGAWLSGNGVDQCLCQRWVRAPRLKLALHHSANVSVRPVATEDTRRQQISNRKSFLRTTSTPANGALLGHASAMASMLEFRTPGFNPYAVKYSPYYDSRIAVAASANYGIVGNGRVFCLGLGPGGVQVEKTFDTNDALYDLSWSEINENQMVVACGDGSIKLFDLNANDFPIMNFHEHKRETFSVCWNPVTKDNFLSSSWDGTVKIVSQTLFSPFNTVPSSYPNITQVVSNANRIPQDPPSRKLHLQRPIQPLQPSPHIHRLLRQHGPALRPAHPRVSKIPFDHDNTSTRPSRHGRIHAQRSDLPRLPAGRDIDPRLEQVQPRAGRCRGRRQGDPHL